MKIKKTFAIFFVILCVQFFELKSAPLSKARALYNSLDCKSTAQHLALYELYRNTPEGQQALKDICFLLSGTEYQLQQIPISLATVDAVLALVNRQTEKNPKLLSDDEIAGIEILSSKLLNRKLKGHYAKSEAEVLALPSSEIDLARGLFLSELGTSDESWKKIRNYEALIDIMALQILARISLESSPEQKIRAMNDFIFDEMGFRFPPHSLYAKDIDVYTFLPSVLDSRKGVCLGVSILYLCLAQRLNLELEMITPPGHIYVRYRNGEQVINIETTARGINVDSDQYLGIETRSLQQRNIKDVIGLAHFNQASVFWKQEQYEKALATYEKAKMYLPNDKLLVELMAYNNLLNGNLDNGKKLLEQVRDYVPDHAVTGESVASDFLDGNVDIAGIKALFMDVDENRDSILKKQKALEKAVEQSPKFRAGLFSLAVSWLQLHRKGEALELLEKYHELEPNDPTAEYYLTVLQASRHNYPRAWQHLRNLEKILKVRNHYPKLLKNLRRQLAEVFPETHD